MNDFSSRSHSMLTIDIASEQQDAVDENLFITKHGKLTFVDLAGTVVSFPISCYYYEHIINY